MRRPLTLAAAAMLGALVLPGVASADPAATPSDSALDPALLERTMDALVDVGVPSVVAEARDGDETWAGAAGDRDPWTGIDTRPTDLVRIGSVTKTMVSTVVLQLVEEGKLELTDTVQELLPGTVPYTEPITVTQLLNHTSGIPDYFLKVYPSLLEGSYEDIQTERWRYYTPQRLVSKATADPLYFTPGSQFSYSNTNYYLAGMIIEELTGTSWERQVKTRVFAPAGMSDTQLPQYSPFILGPHPRAYFVSGVEDPERYDTTEFAPNQLWAAGVAVSDMADVNRLFAALSDGTLLSPESLATMRDLSPQSEGSYGLGLQAIPVGGCDPIPEDIAYGHTGGTFGYSTMSFHSPDGDRQFSFTMTLDDQAAPSQEVAVALGNLLNAGLCSVDTTGVSTMSATDPFDGVMLDRWARQD
ncbi:D-alanyl-D-alanine carboxypeptidase [Stackebrandtia albiflava]|uniref:D-alanyl-D-alanine carboxypeptidase n=1 Tax=Stackebrandtia albiflava TaxID=406432 RepID=A0A562ULE8_9ACTN|nr:serine hydrolase domain-containing protein [Stackebrandtia albiflava]TWJ06435.1 D-alanyl-D-alanine carboxypeptidase [Stackebrandtia albiflava]